MITGELKNKVDRVWDAFWSGGTANPLEVIEQITYLLFIRRLDDLNTLAEKKARRTGKAEGLLFTADQQHLRWSTFKNSEPAVTFAAMSDEVFPFLRELSGRYRVGAGPARRHRMGAAPHRCRDASRQRFGPAAPAAGRAVRATVWTALTTETEGDVAEHLAGLPSTHKDDDEDAKRFDMLVLRCLAQLDGDAGAAERLREQIQNIASGLLI